MLGPSEHIRRLDVGLKDMSTCQQKALCHEFGHQAKKIRHCTKEITYYEKTTC